jgi:hypothetical protein
MFSFEYTKYNVVSFWEVAVPPYRVRINVYSYPVRGNSLFAYVFFEEEQVVPKGEQNQNNINKYYVIKYQF